MDRPIWTWSFSPPCRESSAPTTITTTTIDNIYSKSMMTFDYSLIMRPTYRYTILSFGVVFVLLNYCAKQDDLLRGDQPHRQLYAAEDRNLLQNRLGSYLDPKSTTLRVPATQNSNTYILSDIPSTMGYFNLSCPFEWYKYSCAANQDNAFDEQVTTASKQYYLDHLPQIFRAFYSTLNLSDGMDRHNQNLPQPKRIFMTGDSLLRQVFVSVACNAFSLNAIEQSEVKWRDPWPCPKGFSKCGEYSGGQHSGFDAASIRFKNGMEIHYVSHEGIPPGDWSGTERDVLQRMKRQIETSGGIDFGTKTAFPPSGPMDVLVYNLGAHESPAKSKRSLNMFVSDIATPLMKMKERPKIVYVTTPTAHFNTPNGQYIPNQMDESKKQCIDRVSSNPKADLEKEILQEGINIDILLDYDDLELGALHVHKGDCLHYCMPGVVDLVGARLLESL